MSLSATPLVFSEEELIDAMASYDPIPDHYWDFTIKDEELLMTVESTAVDDRWEMIIDERTLSMEAARVEWLLVTPLEELRLLYTRQVLEYFDTCKTPALTDVQRAARQKLKNYLTNIQKVIDWRDDSEVVELSDSGSESVIIVSSDSESE